MVCVRPNGCICEGNGYCPNWKLDEFEPPLTLIERVAMAIWNNDTCNENSWGEELDTTQEVYRSHARVAIEEIRAAGGLDDESEDDQ